MKKFMLVGASALMMVAVGSTTASAKLAVDTGPKTETQNCVESTTGQVEGVFVWEGPTASWPPNHKDKSATITLIDADDEMLTDDVFLAVTAGHDELIYDAEENIVGEENGSGNTNPATDATADSPSSGTGEASVPVRWRSERSGRGDGRTYTFTASGTTDGAADNALALSTCKPVNFTVEVPHDLGGGNDGARSSKRSKLKRLKVRRK